MPVGTQSEQKATKRHTTPTIEAAPPPGDKASHVAFRQFMQARQAGSSKAKPVNPVPAFRPVLPTAQRLEKADHPLRTSGGFYRVPAPIERLRNRGLLDPSPRVNEGMYTAAQNLAQYYYLSGLAEHIRSQDLCGVGGGSTTAASYMPTSELAAHNRQKFQEACRVMGWFTAHPLRGCGRLVVDVICREMTLKDAGIRFFPETRTENALAAANDRLKEGLFLLAIHWRLA